MQLIRVESKTLKIGLTTFVACSALMMASSSLTAAPAAPVATSVVQSVGLASDAASRHSSTAPAADAKSVEIAASATAVVTGAEFNREGASTALKAAATAAQSCKMPEGPTGTGSVSLTWAPKGEVTDILLVSGPFRGTVVGQCVVRIFRAVKVPPFDGSPITVTKSFSIK